MVGLGKGEPEMTTHSDHGLGVNRSALGFDRAPRDRKAESRSRALRMDSAEWFEDHAELLLGQSGAAVADVKHHFVGVLVDGKRDLALVGVFDRVVEQVLER